MDPNIRVLQAAGLICAGYICRQLGLLDKNDAQSLLKVSFAVTFPAMMLRTCLALQIEWRSFFVFGLAAVHAGLLALAGYHFFKDMPKSEDGALLAGSTVGSNLGNFVYPFAEAIWGSVGLATALFFDLVNQFALLLVSYGLFFGMSPTEKSVKMSSEILHRVTTNPCFLAMYLAIFLRDMTCRHRADVRIQLTGNG
mmetsp:Transcript_8515/g.9901  ORF Transcript_8515/g.9901 Transcript_8515/m.9901 type:complete len:197 (-) Transcript_8515:1874-2464(-)